MNAQTKKLRSGYTTGACAAAAAKAAVLTLLGKEPPDKVSIPFPDGSRHAFALCRLKRIRADQAMATVVKDAGDDPDVTNGAEIGAEVRLLEMTDSSLPAIVLRAGVGVGMITKPGLALAVGEPAINPVPRQMIHAAVAEALGKDAQAGLEISIFVPNGETLAEKTLNKRLGVMGGLSILGTTGIVRPVSAKAWTDTIEASLSVAKAAGLEEVILATGRSSEAAAQARLQLPEEALVMMGDYLRYSLEAVAKHGFCRIHLAAMWAKLIKAALAVPQTHVRNGALECEQAAGLLRDLGLEADLAASLVTANTAREIYDRLCHMEHGRHLISEVCRQARNQAIRWSGLEVNVYLVSASGEIVCCVPD